MCDRERTPGAITGFLIVAAVMVATQLLLMACGL